MLNINNEPPFKVPDANLKLELANQIGLGKVADRLIFEEFAPLFGLWADLFKPFIESQEMYDIYQKLKADGKKEVILPTSDVVFRSFATTDPRSIKSIWYLMDPYPRRYKGGTNQATGLNKNLFGLF